MPRSSIVKLLTNIPFTPNYEITMFFDYATSNDPDIPVGYDGVSQFAYMESHVKVISYDAENDITELADYNDLSYIRANRGRIKLYAKKEKIYDCNYLMFKNEDETKWYFAFIDSINYINDDVCEILYSIDVLQTWHFHYQLTDSFLERQHTITDNLFEHLQAEDVNLGDEYVLAHNNTYDLNLSQSLMLIIIAAYKLIHENEIVSLFGESVDLYYAKCKRINNVYCPCSIFTIPLGTTPETQALADTLINALFYQLDESEVVCVYESTSAFGSANNMGVYMDYIDIGHDDREQGVLGTNIINTSGALDGYTPKNKKLYSYPYNCISINNYCGEISFYKLECWTGSTTRGIFKIHGTNFTIPTCVINPTYYRGFAEDWESGIGFSNFPECAWAGDSFKAYWAQHQNSYAWSNAVTIAGAIFGSTPSAGTLANIGSSYQQSPYTSSLFDANTSPNLLSEVSLYGAIANSTYNIATAVGTSVARWQDLHLIPSQTYGQARFNNIMLATGHLKYTFSQKCIKRQYLKVADDYFTRYGYSIKHLALPNRTARPYFTYIKTVGCHITGTQLKGEYVSPPAYDMKLIEQIYDNGITFWRCQKQSSFGQFTAVDNSPITPQNSQEVVENG